MVEKIREEFMYMDAVNYISDVLQKTKGKELKVAFLGGSLSKGERVKRELCFVSLFEQKIEEKLSNGRKVFIAYLICSSLWTVRDNVFKWFI